MESMTFRTILTALAVASVACGGNAKSGAPAHADSAGGAVSGQTAETGKKLPANPNGRIPVLEYHVIGGAKNAMYTRTAESFKADL
jgi:hypothetical protein